MENKTYKVIFELTTLDICIEIATFILEYYDDPYATEADKKKLTEEVGKLITDKQCTEWMSIRYQPTEFSHEVGSDDDTPDDYGQQFTKTHFPQLIPREDEDNETDLEELPNDFDNPRGIQEEYDASNDDLMGG